MFNSFKLKGELINNVLAEDIPELLYYEDIGVLQNKLNMYVVRFEDLEYWPNVINGLFKKNEAEQIFNRFFDAKPPEFNNDWILYCKESIHSET